MFAHSSRSKLRSQSQQRPTRTEEETQVFIFKSFGVVVYVSQIAVSAHRIEERKKIFNDKFIIGRKYLEQKLGQGWFRARVGATLAIVMMIYWTTKSIPENSVSQKREIKVFECFDCQKSRAFAIWIHRTHTNRVKSSLEALLSSAPTPI